MEYLGIADWCYGSSLAIYILESNASLNNAFFGRVAVCPLLKRYKYDSSSHRPRHIGGFEDVQPCLLHKEVVMGCKFHGCDVREVG